jgi:hypothetical protein
MLTPDAPTTQQILDQLRELYLERALAEVNGLDSDRPYMADLERDIVDHQRAAVGAAVTEIATLRAELSGPLHG